MTSHTFTGKVFIVTGAARGIGRSTVERLYQCGARVILSDLAESHGQASAKEIDPEGESVIFVPCDVRDQAQIAAMVQAAVGRFGRLDGAVNNAGIGGSRELLVDYPEPVWDEVIAVNLTGVFHCMKAEIPLLLQYGNGAIVNVASMAGLQAFPRHSAYSASKHGVVGITLSTAQEYAASGLRINAVCPAFTQTAMVDQLLTYAPHMEKRLIASIPQGRLGTSIEVAEAITWLLSDSSSFVTGIALPVAGGM